jgi:hypothetical protein
MSQKVPKATQRDVQEVVFITQPVITPGVTLNRETPAQEIRRKLGEVKEDWVVVMQQVSEIISGTDAHTHAEGFRLSEVSVSLGFNAKGKLAFIAEAGVEASVSVTFKRS